MLFCKAYVNCVPGRQALALKCDFNQLLAHCLDPCEYCESPGGLVKTPENTLSMKTQDFPELPGRLPGSAAAPVCVPIHLSSPDWPLNHHSCREVTGVRP